MCTFHNQSLQPKLTHSWFTWAVTLSCACTRVASYPGPFILIAWEEKRAWYPLFCWCHTSHHPHHHIGHTIPMVTWVLAYCLHSTWLLLNGTTKYVLHWRNGAADYSMIFIQNITLWCDRCSWLQHEIWTDDSEHSHNTEGQLVRHFNRGGLHWLQYWRRPLWLNHLTNWPSVLRECSLSSIIRHFMVNLWFLYASMFHICIYSQMKLSNIYLP